jgi:hypothetical protein
VGMFFVSKSAVFIPPERPSTWDSIEGNTITIFPVSQSFGTYREGGTPDSAFVRQTCLLHGCIRTKSPQIGVLVWNSLSSMWGIRSVP